MDSTEDDVGVRQRRDQEKSEPEPIHAGPAGSPQTRPEDMKAKPCT